LPRVKEEKGPVGATTEKEGRRGERRPTGDGARDKNWTLPVVVGAGERTAAREATPASLPSFSLSKSTNAWMSPLAPMEEETETRWLIPSAPSLLLPLPSQRDPTLHEES
jgi:hypothetical protein